MSVLIEAKPKPKPKVSRRKICRYIVLKILEWKNTETTFKELETWSRMKSKHIVTAIKDLLSWQCIKKSVNEMGYTTYSLVNKGRTLIKVYEEKQNLKEYCKEYWTPPWK